MARFGIRLHGNQRKYNPREKYTIETLKIKDKDTFEVYWSDGVTLIDGDIVRKHNLRYDEHMMTVPNPCINLQLLELGYENWRTEIKFVHHHTKVIGLVHRNGNIKMYQSIWREVIVRFI